ncbi:hypothetical protein MNBD_NITROSPINAE03-1923 [hydrothermal vent metagenome]|uniref:purine-nucleoside phosphorylase n=1 Tax=hydrothermal vent metagenome TaxID=652676 RepID=A0A3B1BJS1_9ZZZZ
MNPNGSNDDSEESGEIELSSPDTEKRRGARALKRKTERSSNLRRRKPVVSSPTATDEPEADTKSRAKPRAKSVGSKAKSARKKSGARAGKPSKTKNTAKVEEEYEIKSLPDGTQLKVKISANSKKPKRPVPRRKIVDDYGPGPAMFDVGSVQDETEDESRQINLGSIVSQTRRSVTYLKKHLSVQPKVGVILGSGLSSVARLVSEEPISFSNIPGFISPGVEGHPGLVRAGMVGSIPTLICEGRLHYYETGSMKDTVHPIQAFMALGVERLILTTSAGALNPDYRPGDIMFVSDQINLMGDNPLFGLAPDFNPSPFVDVSKIYDSDAILKSDRICRRSRVKSHKGTLAGMRGPVYETMAERAWLKSMGADAVCMSVIPEALAAAHVGVSVMGLALIVNDASSTKSGLLTHERVAKTGQKYAANMKRLIKNLLTAIG